MTKRTYVSAICNVCGQDIPEGEGSYSTINIEGGSYGLDLCGDDFLDFKGAVQSYVEKADTIGGGAKGTARAPGTGGSSATSAGLDPAVVRAWARGVGMEVPEVGRINLDIVNAYLAAQGSSSPQATPVPVA